MNFGSHLITFNEAGNVLIHNRIVTGLPGRVNVQVRALGGVTMVCDCGFTWVDSNVSVQGLEMKRLFKFLNLLILNSKHLTIS